MLLLGIPVEKMELGGERLVAIVAGIDTSVINQKLALGKEGTDPIPILFSATAVL